MQATVFSFDPDNQAGRVVLDSGKQLTFSPEAFGTSGLRLLRPGQRVRIVVDGDTVNAITIITLASPEADE